jgi:putative ATPase
VQSFAGGNIHHFSRFRILGGARFARPYGKAAKDVQQYGNLPVPLHIRNAPTKLMEDLGYGRGYKYSPSFNYKEKQEYLPDKLKGRKYLKEQKD